MILTTFLIWLPSAPPGKIAPSFSLLFFAESLVQSHRWHCHKAARAEADLSVLPRHSAENQKWEHFGSVHRGKFKKRRQYQFGVLELTCEVLGTDQNLAPHT
jgi:hypothetical protein